MLKDLLNEIKGFKYQIILKVLLSKYTENTYREFGHVYFNSITKTVIGHEDSLGRSSQDVFNRIDNWINRCWIRQCFFLQVHYQEVHERNSEKGLIDIKK